VSAAEVARSYPCDDVAGDPTLAAWRGVTVHASPDEVWPWVVQIRLAPYSYDWIDNGGRRSPRRLCGLPDPEPGEPFTTVAGRRRLGRVLHVVPGESLTATIMGAYLSYLLVPADGSTRLLLKVVADARPWLAPALSLGDLVMARRQLLNLKRLAEASAGQRPAK
jgi:hypothetical protein